MASWELHKYYRGVVIPTIKDRLNFLKACPFRLNNTQTHQLIKRLIGFETSAKFDNKKYLEFLEEVWCIGAHIGIVIPEPNEQTEMQKLTELSEILVCIFNTIKPYVSTRLDYRLCPEVSVSITPNSINLIGHTFTDSHIDIHHYGANDCTMISVVPHFNDKYIYGITKSVTDLYESTIKPMCNKDNRLTSINTRLEILQSEKEAIENEN